MAANRFLWIIAILTMLVIAGAFTYRIFEPQLMRAALVPTVEFAESPKAPDPVYGTPAGWLAHPQLAGNAAQWTPEGFRAAPMPGVAVFYITPTAYLGRDRWNAPFDDPATNARLALFLRSQASVFNGVGEIWAPRYRQATFGAFLTTEADARRALDFAYRDIARAFDVFLGSVAKDRPIILAGHSQGSLHLLRLLQEHVSGKPLAKRVVAAYVAGWPISLAVDLPALGLPACSAADQSGCILSWLSFAEPADPSLVFGAYDATPGLTGGSRKGTELLCTNPLTGSAGDAAPAERNLGALVPNDDFSGGSLAPARVPARCDARGLLLIGASPEGFGRFVLPGNNYHVYDYPLFWANLRADVAARLDSFAQQRLARR